MGNGLDYRTLVAELPDWAAPAYDGLEIELMTNDLMLGGVYILMAMMLVLGSLMAGANPPPSWSRWRWPGSRSSPPASSCSHSATISAGSPSA